ncbi:MAG TPA: ACT domain-containing protein [Candidatus Aerophobetes bacterium]|uniref:ACT domain-containing protein n=1 Tax=Aerophobetes bacterium TaxID=2030807 RepID=A0A7V5HZS5_UNCAE|nr:ACT domain-containing protein [Candidatus Aerophobetes bacterium]
MKQVSVFARNEPGRIKKITEVLADENINIRAITIASGDDYGVVKLLVSDPLKACRALKKEGLSVALNEVIAVQMEDKPGGLCKILKIFTENKINIEDAYGFVIKSGEVAVLVINIANIEEGIKILSSQDVRLLTEEDLYRL